MLKQILLIELMVLKRYFSGNLNAMHVQTLPIYLSLGAYERTGLCMSVCVYGLISLSLVITIHYIHLYLIVYEQCGLALMRSRHTQLTHLYIYKAQN